MTDDRILEAVENLAAQARGIAPVGAHPCVDPECDSIVPYDDEPYCFTHSPNSGSFVPGYSYQDAIRAAAKRHPSNS